MIRHELKCFSEGIKMFIMLYSCYNVSGKTCFGNGLNTGMKES